MEYIEFELRRKP